MARPILIFGHPASGKSFAFKTLDPNKTIILDVDCKGSLPWRGAKKAYNSARKNFFAIQTLDQIYNSMKKINDDEKYQHITCIVVDGFGNALVREESFYDEWHNPKNAFEKYAQLAKKTLRIINLAQAMRDNLTVVFVGHVECADNYSQNDVDHLLTPGKQLRDKIKIEGNFLYVFYAKVDPNGNHFFETVPVNSTARTPEGCFPPQIPNDMQAILNTIDAYENGGD